MRAGIATGLVVVVELMAEGEAQERAVIGGTPNLAARLQALAEPGSVVVAESTRRLLGGTFDLKALGPQAIKGFAAPVPTWLVVREAENVTRFEASRSQGMTPFVGREHETASLLDRWRDASEGVGQVALLSGEAGIGKSLILAALRDLIENDPHVTVRYQCSPHHVNDAFYPISSQIWYAAGFVSREPPASRLDKLEAMIALARLDARDIAPFLAALLSIPVGERYPSLDMAPSGQKERTIAALFALFEGLSKDAPVLALLEDTHWIDPTSLNVFSRLVDRMPGLRALLVIAFRPEFAAPWVGRAHVSLLPLNRFGRRQALAMTDRVADGKTLPEKVLAQIVAKTDGVPLFVEELTKNVLESDLLREENGVYVLASGLTPFAIPSTLQDSLMARLDRLAHVKDIAQIGAAIGREFSYRLLEAVSPIQEQALQDALSQLMAANLIHARGAPSEAKYTFKHALVQDTAYASLLRGRRQRIHADIAKALVESFLDQVELGPGVIAHYYTEAGLYEPPARHWLAAAELALPSPPLWRPTDRSTPVLRLFRAYRRAPIGDLSNWRSWWHRRTHCCRSKATARQKTVAALTAAKQLLDVGIGDDLQHFSVLYGLCAAKYVASELDSARALARQFVDLADRQDDPTYRLVGLRLLGTVQFFTGRNREDLEILQKAESYRDPPRHKRLSFRFGYDPSLSVPYYKTMTLFMLGLPDEAMRAGRRARMEAGSLSRPDGGPLPVFHYDLARASLWRF